MILSIYRVSKFAIQNFWRNFWLSLITITMLVLTLLTVNILVVLNFVTDRAIQAVADRVEVSVYFHANASETSVQNAVTYLRSLQQVRDVATISADEALEQFAARHQDDETIMKSLEEIGTNPFGPSLIVKAHEVADFNTVLEALENPQFRDNIREKDFSNYEAIITRIKDTTDRIRTFGIVLSGIFLLIAVLIVFNTVRMGLFIHREEIGIMKLVGASNAFVRAPFLLEMVLLSVVALAVTALLLYPTLAVLEPKFGFYFGGQTVGLINYFEQNGWRLFGLQLAGLVFLTLFSTWLAMRKYLKV
ncbi:FtsX-like permease family protein [Candidatus Parcubacteria bacterium]|nr:FtsX-like permease family protein [Candidatus Parcubacteria bacterium]